MKDYITKGTIIAEPIDPFTVEAGSVCILQVDDIFHRITLLHSDENGDWVVEGDFQGTVDRYDTLLKLCFLDGTSVLPIAMKCWTKILSTSMLYDKQLHEFTIKPHKFKEGKKYQTCTECSASFKASPSQPLCRKCCEIKSIAYLGVGTPTKKDPRVNLPQTMQLARIAYQMGKEDKSEEEFINWLQNKDLWQ